MASRNARTNPKSAYEVPACAVVALRDVSRSSIAEPQHFPARKGSTQQHNTHMTISISINTLIAIALAIDVASLIGIIVLAARS
jgi:hypothetical protein